MRNIQFAAMVVDDIATSRRVVCYSIPQAGG
jgi:hypothetical protein